MIDFCSIFGAILDTFLGEMKRLCCDGACEGNDDDDDDGDDDSDDHRDRA